MTELDHSKVPPWYAEIFPAGEKDGFYQRFGDHAASFVDRGKDQLVVSFDNLSDAGYPYLDIDPWAGKFVRDNGWSHLGIYARGPSWYRDQRLITFLEGLRDTGFFEQFSNVALIGTSMGGFAALAFASLCPGATVVALSPQSSLGADKVPWERRFPKGRHQDWTLPYSDAADHIGDIKTAYVLYDPFFDVDKNQVLRLPQDKITHLKGFGFGHKTAVVLRRMGVLKDVMQGAIENTLTAAEFQKMTRHRKDIYLYRVSMEYHLTARGKETLVEPFRAAFRNRKRANAEQAQAAQAGDA